jgi:hypothetical protein
LKVKVSGSRTTLAVPVTPPLAFSVVVDTPVALDGQCAEHAFAPGECQATQGGNRLAWTPLSASPKNSDGGKPDSPPARSGMSGRITLGSSASSCASSAPRRVVSFSSA